MKKDDNYIRIPEAADLFKRRLKYKSVYKYDKVYRSILAKAKSGMFSPIKINARDLAINKQEFINYVEKQTSEKYEQLKLDLDSLDKDINTNSNIIHTLDTDELLTLIKLNKKLEIPADETLKHIEKLLLIFNRRGV